MTRVVLGFFAVDTLENAPETFVAMVGIGLLAIVLDAVFRMRLAPVTTDPEGDVSMAVATTAREQATWYALDAAEVAAQLGVDVHKGLSTAEATARREQYGPNKFAEAESEPRWHGSCANTRT